MDTITQQRQHEQALIAEVAAGDQKAFAELYDLFAARVFGLSLRLMQNRAQAEEVTQEIFVSLWQGAKGYNPNRGALASWILTITHRRAVDRIRASQASQDRDLKQGIREYEDSYDNVEESVTTKFEGLRVREALGRLSKIQRQAIDFAYYRGLSTREIGEELHLPVSTVKTRVRDAMIRLRDEMGVTA